MDNIEIKKIWIDDEFYEIEIVFSSKNVKCNIKTYVQNGLMSLWAEDIFRYIDNYNEYRMKWVLECYESKKIVVESKRMDTRGNILLEVNVMSEEEFDKIICDEGVMDKFVCQFSIETEIGLLYSFGEKLQSLDRENSYLDILLYE